MKCAAPSCKCIQPGESCDSIQSVLDSNKTGILLAQLGTPDAPDTKSLRRYLKQFLSDRRVIEVNRALWWFILNGIILNTRPKRSAALYKRIWAKDGSPLLTVTKSQVNGLKEELKDYAVEVAFGMRYGNPSLESGIDELLNKGCRKIVLFPLYPQYSAATTASTYDAVFPRLLKERWVPTLSVVKPYFDSAEYIEPLAEIINESLSHSKNTPERLILSYHGIPRAYMEKGDPYCCMCIRTTEALKPKIKFPKEKILHCYQSRFGKDPWLEPYTDETVMALAKSGVKSVAIACPGFTTDCLETLDEMGNELSHQFKKHGGEESLLIPCLNDDARWIKGISGLLGQHLPSLSSNERAVAVTC